MNYNLKLFNNPEPTPLLPPRLIFFSPALLMKAVSFSPSKPNSFFISLQKTSHTSLKLLTFFENHWRQLWRQLVATPPPLTTTLKNYTFCRYFYNGLGYKIFLRADKLFVWVGLTHYTILQLPSSIKVYAKKRRIFIVGYNIQVFNEFISKLRRIRKIDLYKGKGLSEVRTYKGFIRMKSGKKKQY